MEVGLSGKAAVQCMAMQRSTTNNPNPGSNYLCFAAGQYDTLLVAPPSSPHPRHHHPTRAAHDRWARMQAAAASGQARFLSAPYQQQPDDEHDTHSPGSAHAAAAPRTAKQQHAATQRHGEQQAAAQRLDAQQAAAQRLDAQHAAVQRHDAQHAATQQLEARVNSLARRLTKRIKATQDLKEMRDVLDQHQGEQSGARGCTWPAWMARSSGRSAPDDHLCSWQSSSPRTPSHTLWPLSPSHTLATYSSHTAGAIHSSAPMMHLAQTSWRCPCLPLTTIPTKPFPCACRRLQCHPRQRAHYTPRAAGGQPQAAAARDAAARHPRAAAAGPGAPAAA